MERGRQRARLNQPESKRLTQGKYLSGEPGDKTRAGTRGKGREDAGSSHRRDSRVSHVTLGGTWTLFPTKQMLVF